MSKFKLIIIIVSVFIIGALIVYFRPNCSLGSFARDSRIVEEPNSICNASVLSVENTGKSTITIFSTPIYIEGDATVYGEKNEDIYVLEPSEEIEIKLNKESNEKTAYHFQTDSESVSYSYQFL